MFFLVEYGGLTRSDVLAMRARDRVWYVKRLIAKFQREKEIRDEQAKKAKAQAKSRSRRS